MDLGKKISELRKGKGISQEKLAELIGVSRQAVTKWESGKSNPDTENLVRLGEVFGCSVDELCENAPKEKPVPKIHPGGHFLCLASILIVAAYCIIGGTSGNFNAETLIMLIILAVPMHCFTHLAFWGMVKSGEFSMLAGYDSEIKYDTENLKRYVSGLDFMLGFESASYILLMAITALIVPEFGIQYILIFGYIISFVAGIFFMGYKFGDKIYADPKDAEKAKRGSIPSAIMVGEILIACGAFVFAFEQKGYRNNTLEPFPMLGMMFLSIITALAGYLIEAKRLKKADEHAPLFGRAFAVLNIAALIMLVLMVFM